MNSRRNYDDALDLHLDPHPVDSDIFGTRREQEFFGAMEDRKVQWNEDETTGSSLSDLSAEATDEFGRLLLQHHRDEKRLRDATNRQPFRKAKPKPRIAQAILREERLRESAKHDRNGSSGSNDSTPPVTVPREWGRHARRQRHWMRDILKEPEQEDGVRHADKSASADDSEWGSLRHMNTTFGPENLEADDFTSASLLASTPAPQSSRPMRKIDELTRRELLNLDEIDDSPSNTTARHSFTMEPRQQENMSSPSKIPRPLTAPATQSPSSSRIPRRQGSPTKDKQYGQQNGASKSPSPTKPRPKHSRDDSMNLLRKLARVSSMSPSPARKPEANVQIENETEAAPSPSPPKVRKSSGWGVEFDALTKPEPQSSPEPPKIAIEANDAEQPQPPGKSALEDIMRESNQYGESTIQSLEDIAHPNVDPTVVDLDEPAAAAAEVVATTEEHAMEDGLTQEQKDQRQQELAMEGLNKHLQAARTSIKDASRGLRRVENRIEAAQEGQSAPASKSTTIPAPTVVVRNQPDASGFTHCTICGGGYHSVWYAAWVEFRSLFYTYSPTARFGIAFTKLGLFCLTWLLWYLLESTLCEFYCTPKYAIPYSNFPPPGYDTPRFPFTIPMVLFRPWREYWVDWFDALTVGVEAWFHELTHQVPFESTVDPALTVKFSTGSSVFTENVASATAVRVAQSLMDAVDEVGSMWDDDFL